MQKTQMHKRYKGQRKREKEKREESKFLQVGDVQSGVSSESLAQTGTALARG
jgi:hypothetical protein